MRILYASDYSIHDQKRVYYLSKHHQVRTLTFRSYDQLPPASLFNTLQRADWYYPISTPSKIVKGGVSLIIFKHVFLTEKPSVVHASCIPVYSLLAYISHIKPLVAEVVGSEMILDHQLNPFVRLLMKRTLEYAKAVIVDAMNVRDRVLFYTNDEDKIFCIPVGVDTSVFYRSHEARLQTRKILGVDTNDTLVICNRWHNVSYGIENLIAAIPRVLSKHKKVKFLFAGRGPLLNAHRALVRKLNLSSHVIFVPLTPNVEMPKYLSAADLYVSPSYSDGTSVSLLEAMACELPVVITSLPAIREWVVNRKNGILVERSDPALIANALSHMLLIDLSERKKIGRKNRDIIKKRAEIRESADSLTKVYEYAIQN